MNEAELFVLIIEKRCTYYALTCLYVPFRQTINLADRLCFKI